MQKHTHEQKTNEQQPSNTDVDLTSVFRDAGMRHTATASKAFETKYQLQALANRAPYYYELIWGVRLAIDASILTRRLRTRRGKALLLELPVLQAEAPNEDLRIVINLLAHDHLHLMLLEEFQELSAYRVLVAENDEMTAAALNRTLCRAGFEVAITRTGAATIELAQDENFDLALIDVDLCDVHGFALCAQLRSNPLTQDLPLVICSAWQGTGELAAQAGAIGYLEKPQDFGGLPERLRQFLRLAGSVA